MLAELCLTRGVTVANANVEINGAALRELRKLAGHNITELASIIDCSFQYLSQLETGARTACSPALYARICDALHLDDRTLLLRATASVEAGEIA